MSIRGKQGFLFVGEAQLAQQRKSEAHTTAELPKARLAGLYLFMQMQEVMSTYTADELKELTWIFSLFFDQSVWVPMLISPILVEKIFSITLLFS
ncbi:hypothetical protein [Serratia sp. DD3]|uniref:hypothetical protein n=1 Tax=Serratia sp. DD3 TaxID=1410619 RepID=UPI0003C52DB8|nr:hypothetical protein [Serratia sp. DD3]KEY60042.1 hypothetical protein SRDD_11520 [Serratia sp. DD3]